MLIFMGSILLPFLCFYLAFQESLFYENFTYVGNQAEFRSLFILWGCLQACFFFVSYLLILINYNIYSKKYIFFCGVVSFIHISATLSPFTNHSNDFLSTYHVIGSMLACILTYVLVMAWCKRISDSEFLLSNQVRILLYYILSAFTFTIFILGDISSLSELILVNGLNFVFIYILKSLPPSL